MNSTGVKTFLPQSPIGTPHDGAMRRMCRYRMLPGNGPYLRASFFLPQAGGGAVELVLNGRWIALVASSLGAIFILFAPKLAVSRDALVAVGDENLHIESLA